MDKMSFHQVMVSLHQAMIALGMVVVSLMDYLSAKFMQVFEWIAGFLHIPEPHVEMALAVVGLVYFLGLMLRVIFFPSFFVRHGDPVSYEKSPWAMRHEGPGCIAVKNPVENEKEA